MEWKSAFKNEQGLVKVPKRWLHLHYYEALNILFRFENSLRVFVYAILKNEYSCKWIDCNFGSEGNANAIKTIASKRISQSDSFGYLGFDIKAPLMHLTSGELVEIITSEAYWPHFKPYFKGNKEIIKNKLLEIGTIRNSLAHFRPMRPDDIEVIKQNSKHTLIGVESCLANLFSQSLRVPTNTSEHWYKSISTLGTAQIVTTPYYSENESWVNIQLTFKTPVLSKKTYSDNFFVFELARINTAAILSKAEKIRESVTYISEHLDPPVLTESFDLEIGKDLNFVFRKDVLVKNAAEIAEDFSKLLHTINGECELLQQDALARGLIVEPSSGYSWWQSESENQKGRWNHSYEKLRKPYQSDDPDEYWGQKSFSSDVVAGLHRYPWMPESISDVEGFGD